MIECDVIEVEGTVAKGHYRRQEYLVYEHRCFDIDWQTVQMSKLFLQRKTWTARMLGCRCVVFVGLCSGCGKWIVAR